MQQAICATQIAVGCTLTNGCKLISKARRKQPVSPAQSFAILRFWGLRFTVYLEFDSKVFPIGVFRCF